ncbi:MAG: phosphoenolpyruvate--protein phosphotransferase [Desulfuromonadales bacterium]|nr:phosphoenolpyruvate--protein phosphotransferase [Desulfuromonadales bacterium]
MESAGLRTIEDINRIILNSHNLEETLNSIVNTVEERMKSDSCSIYLMEQNGETLRLAATKGLKTASVGEAFLKVSEGLTGLAIEKKEVINLIDAYKHPRYKHLKGTGEEQYNSFLGIPLFEKNMPVGVIVIQDKEPRQYTEVEIGTLSAIAYQVASIVIYAKLLDSINQKDKEHALLEEELQKFHKNQDKRKSSDNHVIFGKGVSPGFAIGNICLINRKTVFDPVVFEKAGTPEEESERFNIALEKVRIQTLYMEKRVAESLSAEDATIFNAYLMILEDQSFTEKIHDLIKQHKSAGLAVQEVINHYVKAFSEMEDPYFRSRSADIEDIGQRIIDALSGNRPVTTELMEKRILVAKELLPSDLASIDLDKVLGIVTEKGDSNSHTTIMAKSLAIPAVVGVQEFISKLSLGDELIIDGNIGSIYINPAKHIKEEYERLKADDSKKRKELELIRGVPAITKDGFKISLMANIGLISDVKIAKENGAEGVGLYRTEFPYMTRKTFPTRNEQYKLLKHIIEEFSGLSVTIRTLDIGGDKGLPYFNHPPEDNPFMGWRAVRISLECREIFYEQLAAILMASAHGKARIMIPMITGLEEIVEVKKIVESVKSELRAKGIPFDENIPVGIMIETPAAVQVADILAKEVDFFSIGTNDLMQYTLVADRNNPKVKEYCNPFHPALLRSIKSVIDAANNAKIDVSVCGEMAGNKDSSILLVGMGVSDLSMASPSIPFVKQSIMNISMEDAKRIADSLLKMGDCQQISDLLHEMIYEKAKVATLGL